MKNKFIAPTLEIAKKAGSLLMEYFGNLSPDKIAQKSQYDLVTEADKASEKFIVEKLSALYPTHAIHGEEFTQKEGSSEYKWFIDPLDGTTNFAHAHPFFAVSLGLVNENNLEIGVVYAPYLKELFFAAKGEGAYLNDNAIAVSSTKVLEKSLVATGFPYKREGNPYNNIDNFAKVLPQVQGVRRCGAAALELCYLACGRYDGFWELWLNAHDVAAGALIIEEAGGKVSDWQGGQGYLFGKNIVASNGSIHKNLQQILLPFPKEQWGFLQLRK